MEVLYLLIPLSMVLVGLAIWLFMWAVKNEQFEDLDGPGHSILYDDDEAMIPPEARIDEGKPPQRKPEKDTGKDPGTHG